MSKPTVPFVFVPDPESETNEFESRSSGRGAPRRFSSSRSWQRRPIRRRRWLPWIFRAPALPWIMQPRILDDEPEPPPPSVDTPSGADQPEPDGP